MNTEKTMSKIRKALGLPFLFLSITVFGLFFTLPIDYVSGFIGGVLLSLWGIMLVSFPKIEEILSEYRDEWQKYFSETFLNKKDSQR